MCSLLRLFSSAFNVDGCYLFRFGNLPFCQRGKVCRRCGHECAYQFGILLRVSFPCVAVDDFYRHPQPVLCKVNGAVMWFLLIVQFS
ncbi:hypothetical protein ECTW06591_0849 [Escherichia coli TW06591]|nr:hypothetical protein ECTW06591_0849 [Escherichia coli TW06591]